MRQALPSEQGHECVSERRHSLIERFEGALTTDRIAEQHRDKIDHLVMCRPRRRAKCTCSSRAASTRLSFEVVGDQSHLSTPSQALRKQIVKRRGRATDESEIPIISPAFRDRRGTIPLGSTQRDCSTTVGYDPNLVANHERRIGTTCFACMAWI